MKKQCTSPEFSGSGSFVGLDFLARSLVRMEHNGTTLKAEELVGNMTDEQKDIFMARLLFHREHLHHKRII